MSKIKVFELSKELNLENKDVIKKLQKFGCNVSGHLSVVDDKYADMLREALGSKNGSAAFVPKVKRIPKKAAVETEVTAAEPEAVKEGAKPVDEKSCKQEAVLTEQKPITEEKIVAKPVEIKEEKPVIENLDIKNKISLSGKTEPPRPVEVLQHETLRTDLPRAEYKKNDRFQKQNRPSDNREAAEQPKYNNQRPQQSNNRQFNNQNNRDNNRDRGNNQFNNQRNQEQRGNFQQNQGAKGNFQNQRPQNRNNQGGFNQNRNNNYNSFAKDKDADAKPHTSRSPKQQNNKKDSGFAAAPIEKPTSNYRQEKKVFTKDIVFERSSNAEKERWNQGNKNRYKKDKKEPKQVMPPVTPKKITIPEFIVLGELAKAMGKNANELIKKLFEMGSMATINQELDADTAILLASEFGVSVEVQTDKVAEIMEDIEDDARFMVERPPVVTVMGHVDHGKTSLLDAIRKTNVISTEAGGITQHIGAYQVEINEKKITFLDTPGHEAFTAMRARGAQITDISILVVAADDGVMPQTIEAINHSKAANVPIIVAINKIDKETANPDRVKRELMDHGLVPEEWGGSDIMVPISAKKGEGIENLLEMVLLVAEVAELKANPKRQARGTVVEAELDKSRGPVATLLIQKGTLKIGDSILAGGCFGKVRAMNDDKGKPVRSAGPSTPVEVLGFSEVPEAGEIFISVKDDKDARLVAYKQQMKKREEILHKSSRVSLEDLFDQISQGEIKELNIVLKADVFGSVEAVRDALVKLNTDEVKVNVIHAGAGAINESDVMLASASNAIIIGFNIRPDANARKAAETEKVDIRLYRVIYDAVNDVKQAMAGLLAPEFKEQIIGHAEVRTVFKVPKAGMVAGSYITDGKISRNAQARIIRDNIVIYEGHLASLKRFKDDAKEVVSGFECGISIENYNDIKEGDVIEAFIMEEIAREL